MKALVLILTLVFTQNTNAEGPSFDCKQAMTSAEKEICRLPGLAEIDKKIADVYAYGLKILNKDDKVFLIKNQKKWLKQRDMACCSTAETIKYPSLGQTMEQRLVQLTTYLKSPGIDLTNVQIPKSKYKLEPIGCGYYSDESADCELISASVSQYMQAQAEVIFANRYGDNFSGTTVEEINKFEQLAYYYGPAILYGHEEDQKDHCDDIWELFAILNGKLKVLEEYYDSNGKKINLTDLNTEAPNTKLHACEKSEDGITLTYWVNNDAQSAEVGPMRLVEYVYNPSSEKVHKGHTYIKEYVFDESTRTMMPTRKNIK